MLRRTYLPFLHSIFYHTLNVIHARQINDIVAVQNHLARQLVHVLADLGMLDHHNNHINVSQESIQIVILVLDHILGDEGVVHLQTEAVTANFLSAEKAASVSCPSVLKNAEYKSDPASAGLPVRTFFYHKPVHSRSDLPALSGDKNIWDFP